MKIGIDTQRSAFWVIHILLYLVAFVLCLYTLGLNITALLAGLGILALAVSFAAQDAIANIIAGFLIILTKPFRIGDYISFKGGSGWVDTIGLRATNVATYDSNTICVPNSELIASSLVNSTDGAKKSCVAVPFSIEPIPNMEKVVDKLKKIPPKIPGTLVDAKHPVVVNINPFERLGKTFWSIEVLFWVKDSHTEKAAITTLSQEVNKFIFNK